MSYVDSNLASGEQVVYRARLHWTNYLWGLIFLVVGFAKPLLLGLGVLLSIRAFIRSATTEMAVTNKRVIAKVGLISRRTLEMNLAKIENISIDQPIFGRMLNYGTITVCGTG